MYMYIEWCVWCDATDNCSPLPFFQFTRKQPNKLVILLCGRLSNFWHDATYHTQYSLLSTKWFLCGGRRRVGWWRKVGCLWDVSKWILWCIFLLRRTSSSLLLCLLDWSHYLGMPYEMRFGYMKLELAFLIYRIKTALYIKQKKSIPQNNSLLFTWTALISNLSSYNFSNRNTQRIIRTSSSLHRWLNFCKTNLVQLNSTSNPNKYATLHN